MQARPPLVHARPLVLLRVQSGPSTARRSPKEMPRQRRDRQRMLMMPRVQALRKPRVRPLALRTPRVRPLVTLPPLSHHGGTCTGATAAAAEAAAAGTAAGLAGDVDDDRMAIDMILQRLEDSGETRSPEEVAAQEVWTTRQLELEADARRADAHRRQEQDAADAARAQQEAEDAASEAEAWRLWHIEACMAWADVPHGTTFSQEEIEAHGFGAFAHLQGPKAAFDRRMLNKHPLAEPTASPQVEADAPEEDLIVSGETVASPDVMPIVTDPASPAGAELPQDAPSVKTAPAQPLACKPQPVPAFIAPPPPKMPGSSTDADSVPSKPKPKLYKVQPCTYTDVRYAAGAVPRSDAEAVAMGQAARLEAAQRAARLAAA